MLILPFESVLPDCVKLANISQDWKWLQTWSSTTVADDCDLKILSQADNVFSEVPAA
jgi:hypothetical protein